MSPYRNAEAAIKRRNVVLAKLLDDNIITKKQYDAAHKEKLPQRALVKVTNEAPLLRRLSAPGTRPELSERCLGKRWAEDFTGLDLRLQKIAEKALSEGLTKLESSHPALKKKSAEEGLEGAIVVIRPQTGEIKAMVGGRNYQKSQFNRVFQAKRQAGSVFKPFVFLAAFMHGGQSGMQYFAERW